MMATITELRAKATLDKVFRYPEGVMSRRDWVAMKLAEGAKFELAYVEDEAQKRAIQKQIDRCYGRALRLGEDSPIPALKKQLQEMPDKPKYRLWIGDVLYEVTKIEYDYFSERAA